MCGFQFKTPKKIEKLSTQCGEITVLTIYLCVFNYNQVLHGCYIQPKVPASLSFTSCNSIPMLSHFYLCFWEMSLFVLSELVMEVLLCR